MAAVWQRYLLFLYRCLDTAKQLGACNFCQPLPDRCAYGSGSGSGRALVIKRTVFCESLSIVFSLNFFFLLLLSSPLPNSGQHIFQVCASILFYFDFMINIASNCMLPLLSPHIVFPIDILRVLCRKFGDCWMLDDFSLLHVLFDECSGIRQ